MTLPTNGGKRRSRSARVRIPANLEKPKPDKETRRELAKLTATYFNSLAAAIFAVGGLAPIVAVFASASISSGQVWRAGMLSAISLLCSVAAHIAARYLLGREFTT